MFLGFSLFVGWCAISLMFVDCRNTTSIKEFKHIFPVTEGPEHKLASRLVVQLCTSASVQDKAPRKPSTEGGYLFITRPHQQNINASAIWLLMSILSGFHIRVLNFLDFIAAALWKSLAAWSGDNGWGDFDFDGIQTTPAALSARVCLPTCLLSTPQTWHVGLNGNGMIVKLLMSGGIYIYIICLPLISRMVPYCEKFLAPDSVSCCLWGGASIVRFFQIFSFFQMLYCWFCYCFSMFILFFSGLMLT